MGNNGIIGGEAIIYDFLRKLRKKYIQKNMTNHHLVIKKNCIQDEEKKFNLERRKLEHTNDASQFSYLRNEIEAIICFSIIIDDDLMPTHV